MLDARPVSVLTDPNADAQPRRLSEILPVPVLDASIVASCDLRKPCLISAKRFPEAAAITDWMLPAVRNLSVVAI